MGLEEDIQKLKEAEIGQVEKTIRTIEDFNSEDREIANQQGSLLNEYAVLVRQKLPVAIDNLCLLKDYLLVNQIYPWTKNEIKLIFPQKRKKKIQSYYVN